MEQSKRSVQHKKIVQYLKTNFSKKNNLWRLLFFTIGTIIALTPSLTCNLMIRAGSWHPSSVVYNTGIAFSMLDGHSSLVYCLQSIVCGVVLIAILFLREWYYIILLSLAFVGGIFNMVDRATQFLNHQPNAVANSVIDYLNTGTTTSNFPDVFILTGVIGFTALFVIISVVNIIRPPKTSDKTKSEVK